MKLFLPYLMLIVIFAFGVDLLTAQEKFTRKDSLRGSLRTERNYNVLHYDLALDVEVDDQKIAGSVKIKFIALEDLNRIQIDLYENLNIQKIVSGTKELKYKREFDAVFIELKVDQDEKETIVIHYYGKPKKAKNAPWDGGFVWKKDAQGEPWIGVACEGDGASLWWPNKDHLSDEPDEGMDIRITCRKPLMAISNGRLIDTVDAPGNRRTWHWKVSYPINNYNVSINIANYAHFSEVYRAKDQSELNLNYYVLKENEEKAKIHFSQVHKMLESFEHYFDKYPFWNDGYALIETPYLGMEHQSGIAYGNQYQRGYLGGRIPQEFNFDFIILHESGHEYFGNSVSINDYADMWIHEGFTTYMEALYVEYLYGKKAALRYLESQRSFITHAHPLLGPRHVNYTKFPDSDIYYKGSWVLQTLRFSLKNDAQWFELLKSFYQKFKYRNIDTEDFIVFVNDFTKKDYRPFFNLYLTKTELPLVKLRIENYEDRTRIFYRLESSEPKLELPIELSLDNRIIQLDAGIEEKNIEFRRSFKSVTAVNTQSLVNIESN